MSASPPTAQPAASGGASSSSGNSIMSALNPLGAVVGVAQGLTAIVGAISQIKEQKKQAEYNRALSNMSYADQQKLNQQMLRASTASERLQILANAVAQVRAAQTTAAINSATSAGNTTMILVIGGGIAILIAAFLIKKS